MSAFSAVKNSHKASYQFYRGKNDKQGSDPACAMPEELGGRTVLSTPLQKTVAEFAKIQQITDHRRRTSEMLVRLNFCKFSYQKYATL